MSKEYFSLADGILAAIKIGTENAVSVVTRPLYTTQVILGMKPGNDVSKMLVEEIHKRKVKHISQS